MVKENTRAIIYTGIAVLSWSTVATAFKIALRHLSYFEMLLMACYMALFIFGLSLTFQKKWKLIGSLPVRQWVRIAMIGLLNPIAYYLVLFKAYALLPAQIAQPINYAWPIVLLILLAVFAKQPIPVKKYIGMFISLLGVAFISLGAGGIADGFSVSLTGLLLAASSAFIWATYWMVNNRNRDVDSGVVLFVSFLFASICLTVWAWLTGVRIHTLTGILSGMYVGGFEIGVPFLFFGLAMRKSSNPALVNQLCYLSPFLSLFLIAMVLGEKIVISTYIGLALIVFGIIFNEYLVKRRQEGQTI